MSVKNLIEYVEKEAGYTVEECYEEHWADGDVKTAGSILRALYEWKEKLSQSQFPVLTVRASSHPVTVVRAGVSKVTRSYTFLFQVELDTDSSLSEATRMLSWLDDQVQGRLIERLSQKGRYVTVRGQPEDDENAELELWREEGKAFLIGSVEIRTSYPEPTNPAADALLLADIKAALLWLEEEGFEVLKTGKWEQDG